MLTKDLSKSEIRRLRRQGKLDYKDHKSKCEGDAMTAMQINGPVQQPRINFTYVNGGYSFTSGKKHRKIG